MHHVVVDPRRHRDISPDVTADGRLRVMPASYYASTTVEERALFCVRHGAYLLPTHELVDLLGRVVAGRTAVEIGAGNGVLARALGIVGTDSRLQDRPEIAAYYRAMGQPVVPYGADVVTMDAAEAVQAFRPEVVVASWVTHRYDSSRHGAGGNEFGVVEEDVLRGRTYVFVGNRSVHAGKSVWTLPHRSVEPDFVFSRATSGAPDFVAVWGDPGDARDLFGDVA